MTDEFPEPHMGIRCPQCRQWESTDKDGRLHHKCPGRIFGDGIHDDTAAIQALLDADIPSGVRADLHDTVALGALKNALREIGVAKTAAVNVASTPWFERLEKDITEVLEEYGWTKK